MKKITFILFLFIIHQLLYAQPEEKRIALVIGNSNYESAPLKNPLNDANLMANTLAELGFEVIKIEDATRLQMAQGIADFWSKLGSYHVALFFYAGHGVQVNGINYLIPVDAALNTVDMVSFEAISVNEVVAKFELYPRNTNIVILDACRNNPFRSWARGNEYGFKAMNPGSGTFIAFATSEGATASDGVGENGMFTENLVKHLKKPIPIETVFKNTRIDVQYASGGSQSPQEWTKLTGDFYFLKDTNIVYGKITETVEKSNKPVIIKNKDLVVTEELITGSIKILNEFDGDFYFDGKLIGHFSAGKLYFLEKVKTGNHELRINDWIRNVNVTKDKTLEIFTYSPITGIYADEKENKTYHTIKIGNNTWLFENMHTSAKERDCYNNDYRNCEKYGNLYEWEIAQKICPKGWRLPSKEEFEELLPYIAIDVNRGFSSIVSEKIIDFDLHAGGYRNGYGRFSGIGSEICYWTSTKRDQYSMWYLNLNKDNQTFNFYYDDKSCKMSVRCVKDKDFLK